MALIPNTDVPHYVVEIDAFVTSIHDGRGLSNKKTLKVAKSLSFDIMLSLFECYFGENAIFMLNDLGSHDAVLEFGRYRAHLDIRLPAYVSLEMLNTDIKLIIDANKHATGEFYVPPDRHYTQPEIEKIYMEV